MPRTLIVNSLPFEYPNAGETPGWGDPAADWAEEVTKVLTDLVGPDDILETTFSVANNQTTYADVTGLIFNGGSVRSSIVTYSIFRTSDANPSGNTETGTLTIVYDNNAATPWKMAHGDIVGNAGLYFDITNSGQVQYKTTDIGDLNYIGVMKFSAKSQQQ